MPLTKEEVIEKAYELGMADIGFTTAEVFASQEEILASRRESSSCRFRGSGPRLT